MLSKIPIKLKKLSPEDLNNEVLRAGMIAELDAINLYEQLTSMATDPKIVAVLKDVAKEEKTHFGEFQYLLLQGDHEQKSELIEAEQEVQNILRRLEAMVNAV